MTYEAFKILLFRDIKALLPDDKKELLTIVNYYKNNGAHEGLILPVQNGMSANVSINQMYNMYSHGADYGEILSNVKNMLESTPEFSMDGLVGKVTEPSNVILNVVNTEKNKERLKSIPHIKYQDLSIIFRSKIDENCTTVINNQLLDMMNVSKEQLYEIAKTNCKDSYEIKNMSQIIKEMLMEDMPEEMATAIACSYDVPMWVVTNQGKAFGAAAIADNDILDEVAKTVATEKVIILPSSIHEIICLPYEDELDVKDLTHMVNEVNMSEVSPEEILSDNVYIYDSKAKKMEMVKNDVPTKKQNRNI